ncbi:AAA family ATPase [Maridesulfovibrio sp.]|uniref:ParA family protein n=1 Tax=Maridesulfovibrio sp. TaxID=2795000 RepID=UPI0029F5A69B|nr:AAA family ATPase [Maridesulfovibrio sp.]
MISIYSFYNNKGGVGKTTLCQNAAALYAQNNPNTQVLVLDLCPQANVSQFLLGGGEKGYKENQKLQQTMSRTNIVGFLEWMLRGNSGFTSLQKNNFAIQVSKHNQYIPDNVYLIAGDSFLESLSLALNYSVLNPANLNAWTESMSAIKRLCELQFQKTKDQYKKMTVFIDCNPSFSIYTQMALASSDYLIVPMMADYSSLEGIKSLLMLLYGKYPSSALKKYADNILTFNRQIEKDNLSLPTLFEFVFNNYTINSGVATAFDSVKEELVKFCYDQYNKFPNLFTSPTNNINSSSDWEELYLSKVKDFHSAGKVSASLGIPMHELPNRTNYIMPDGEKVNLPKKNYQESLIHIQQFVKELI